MEKFPPTKSADGTGIILSRDRPLRPTTVVHSLGYTVDWRTITLQDYYSEF